MFLLYLICAFQDFDKLALFLKTNYEIDLEKKDLSTRGWNWGAAEFDGL